MLVLAAVGLIAYPLALYSKSVEVRARRASALQHAECDRGCVDAHQQRHMYVEGEDPNGRTYPSSYLGKMTKVGDPE